MDFSPSDLERARPRLLVFCYQLLGSPFEAEDAVQDTMERAWRARDGYATSKGSLEAWTFRIARNICFDRLRQSPRRPLPRDLSAAGLDVGAPLVPALDVPWLMPAPASWWEESVPEQSTSRAEAFRVAVTAALQLLPPRQRGVFILRESLACTVAETAAALEMTEAAVTSAHQRARAAVQKSVPRTQPLRAGIVDAYAAAIERADVDALAALVADDVLFEMPPVPQWSRGRGHYAAFMAHLFEIRGRHWRATPAGGSSQPGLLLFRHEDDGYKPHTVQVFAPRRDGDAIAHVLVYQDPRLFALFAGRTDDSRGARS